MRVSTWKGFGVLVAIGASALVVPGALAAQVPTFPPTRTIPFSRVPDAQVSSSVAVADSLVAAGELDQAYAVLRARLDVAPDDVHAWTLAVQVALAQGILGETAEVRLAWLRAAGDDGVALLALRPNDPDVMAWAAAARGRLALAEDSMRDVVRLAEEVWELTGRLLERAPDHPLGNHVRGKMNQEAMRLPGVKRFLARLFLGFDLPAEASWAQAEEHMLRAVAGDPEMVLFRMDLGDTYRFQGKVEEARSVYEDALNLPDVLPVDPHLKGLLRRRLRDLGAGTL